ncbi:MAG TPA: DUF4112 domain-containing protein [Myxococcaceae bacterium]|nr:DUF4112 domain-containing protein [Myxococcaceae bacterium]
MSRRPPPTRSPSGNPRVDRLHRLAHGLDASIPLPFGMRIGWDALIGLVPGFGDGAGAMLSAYIVLEAALIGVSPVVLTRMVGNVALEALVGTIPFLGDVFDAAWKANLKNVRLLEQHLAGPNRTRRASALWIAGAAATLFGLLIGAVMLAVWVINTILTALVQ